MKLSTKVRYGLRLAIYFAKNYDRGYIQLSEVSKFERISLKYLEQIIVYLKNSKIVTSQRGSKGGYKLSKEPKNITVKEIIESIEGPIKIIECLDKKNCFKINNCETFIIWKKLNEAINNTLQNTTLEDLINNFKKNTLFYEI